MALSKEELEYYHERGQMPDWAYYAQCDYKTPEAKLKEQVDKAKKQVGVYDKYSIKIDKEQAEKALNEAIKDTVDDLIKGLNIS